MIHDLLANLTGYPGLFAFCLVSGLLVPLPEDLSLLYAGMRIGSGEMAVVPTLVVAMVGVTGRDVIAYAFGRFVGDQVLSIPWVRRLVGGQKVDLARRMVASHGVGAVLVGRFFVGLRAPVFLIAGASGVGFRKFLAVDLVGMLVAVPVVVWLGYVYGEPLAEDVLWLVRNARWIVIGAFVVVGAIAWRRWHVERRAAANATSDPSPERSVACERDM